MMGKLDEGFGTLGNVHQLVKSLQASTGKGEAIVATEDDIKELLDEAEGFPMLAKQLIPGLNRILSRVKGTGTALDTDTLLTKAEERVATRFLHEAKADLLSEYPDYHEIVWGDQDDGRPFSAVKTPFTAWMATQAEPIRKRLYSSNNPDYLARQLTRFKTETTAKPSTAEGLPKNDRTTRLAAAVTPKGVAPASAPAEEDSFRAGFNGESKKLGLKT